MFTEIYLTRIEAADEAGDSYDTVRREEKDGRLPNTRVAQNGVKEVRLDDLVAAELIDPVTADGILEAWTAASKGRPAPPPGTRADRDAGNLARDLAVPNGPRRMECSFATEDAALAWIAVQPASTMTSQTWRAAATWLRSTQALQPA